MGISSLGVGSSILTQDVLDQLRVADESKFITPITTKITAETKKQDSLEVIDAAMKNFIDSIDAIKSPLIYNERKAVVTGSSVSVTSASNSDIGEFTLKVNTLATKQVEESAAFTAKTETIANGAGSLNLNIDGTDYTINYDATTTLDDLKNLINEVAGDKVDATVAQMSGTDFRLFISSSGTGTGQDITITDTSAQLKDTRLTTGLNAIQSGVNASFDFNGVTLSRTSNVVTDLISGLTVTLKEEDTATSSSTVSIEHDRDNFFTKVDSFVEKYNSAITELNKATKASKDSTERGAMSTESSIKNMKQELQDMFASVGEGAASLADFGFSIDKDGKMSVDKTKLGDAMDDNMTNVQSFFSGGTYTKDDLSTVTLTGVFAQMSTTVKGYTDSNAMLDDLAESYTDSITALNEQKTRATERLDARYEILKKQYAAYDLIISRLNSVSSMFSQMVSAQNAAS